MPTPAKRLLERLLADGQWHATAEIEKAAAEEGIAWRNVARARTDLVQVRMSGFGGNGGHWEMRLPPSKEPQAPQHIVWPPYNGVRCDECGHVGGNLAVSSWLTLPGFWGDPCTQPDCQGRYQGNPVTYNREASDWKDTTWQALIDKHNTWADQHSPNSPRLTPRHIPPTTT